DRLFDRGFIGFEDSGKLIVSPVAHRESLQRMGIEIQRVVNWGTSLRASASSSTFIGTRYFSDRYVEPRIKQMCSLILLTSNPTESCLCRSAYGKWNESVVYGNQLAWSVPPSMAGHRYATLLLPLRSHIPQH